MTDAQTCGTKARALPSPEDDINPLAYSEENLSWYTYSLTKEIDKQSRLHGWRIITKALSDPVIGEGIVDYTIEGNLIIDRTHHMRTVTTRSKGNSVLFEWRKKFEGNDHMFVEFITEAMKMCSFTVPGPQAMGAILERIGSIEDWISGQQEDEEKETPNQHTAIRPHFRVCLKPFQHPHSEESEEHQARQKAISEWEALPRGIRKKYKVDLIFSGRYPHSQLFKSMRSFIAGSPRYYFADDSLSDFDAHFKGNEVEGARFRREIKSSIVSILKNRLGNSEEGWEETTDLNSYLMSRDDGSHLMDVVLQEANNS